MKNKILLLVVFVLTVVLIFETNNKTREVNKEKIIKINSSLEEYCIGVVAAEMPASFSFEALKTQAILARTIAVYNNGKNAIEYTNITDQAYISKDEMKNKWGNDYDKYYEVISKAVIETQNLVITNNNNVIKSYYYAMSNGFTESSKEVFNEELDYIKEVKTPWENDSINKFEYNKTFQKKEICELLDISCDEIRVENIIRDKSLRVSNITINSITFKGTEFRNKLNLRSTDFDIYIDDEINIITRGYGHGVGLSQYGANEMAKLGYNYKDIINYYYNNVEIKKI